MTAPPLAHAGHVLAQLVYAAPLVLLVLVLLAGKLRERRERRRAGGAPTLHPPPDAAPAEPAVQRNPSPADWRRE